MGVFHIDYEPIDRYTMLWWDTSKVYLLQDKNHTQA